jgi:hypothetical protein
MEKSFILILRACKELTQEDPLVIMVGYTLCWQILHCGIKLSIMTSRITTLRRTMKNDTQNNGIQRNDARYCYAECCLGKVLFMLT